MDPYISKSGRYLAHDVVCDYGVFIKTSSTIKSEDAIEFTDVEGKWKLITCLGQSSNAKVIVDVLEDDYNVTHGIVDEESTKPKEVKFRIVSKYMDMMTGNWHEKILYDNLNAIEAQSRLMDLRKQDPLIDLWIEEDT